MTSDDLSAALPPMPRSFALPSVREEREHKRAVLEEWARLNGIDITDLDAEIERRAREHHPWIYAMVVNDILRMLDMPRPPRLQP